MSFSKSEKEAVQNRIKELLTKVDLTKTKFIKTNEPIFNDEEFEELSEKKPDFSSLFKNPIPLSDINTNYYNEKD